jgi:hypothetical protein
MKTNIKLRVTPTQSEAVQKICFANNIFWNVSGKQITNADAPYLFIQPNELWYSNDYNSYVETQKYIEVDADLFIRTNGTCEGILVKAFGNEYILDEKVIESFYKISSGYPTNQIPRFKSYSEIIMVLQEPECQFAKYGFEKPDFECAILGEVDDIFIGYVRIRDKQVYPTHWYKNGCRNINEGNIWNLKPIKKPWYETCKFPCLVWDIYADKLEVATHVINHTLYLLSDIRDHSEVRLLTNDEMEELKQ